MAYTTVDDSEAYFQAKIWNGNSSTQAITFDGETDMSPSLVWGKQRSGTHHIRFVMQLEEQIKY